MFAVIKTGGKQYRVVAEDVLRVERVEAEPGTVVEFGEVLVVGGEPPLLGTPTVAGATVARRGARPCARRRRSSPSRSAAARIRAASAATGRNIRWCASPRF